MKALWRLFFTVLLPSLYAKDHAVMKEAKNQARLFAKENAEILEEQLLGDSLAFTIQDLLPEEDKGKEFDLKAADHPSDLGSFLENTKKRETFEDNEILMQHAQAIVKDPLASCDIASLSPTVIPAEEQLYSCQEEGTFLASFSQTLIVHAQPEVKQSIKLCNGHTKKRKFFWKSDAENYKKQRKRALSKYPELSSFTVFIENEGLLKDCIIVSEYSHVDNASSCKDYRIEEKIIQQAREEDHWESNDPEGLDFIQSTPSCKLLYSQMTQGPETRIINTKPVFRDSWTRRLHFSCEPNITSKCSALREQGGVLIRKKCLEENLLGECNLWEKVYDLGKKGSYQQNNASFKKEDIWGLNNDFENTYDKNTDLGPAIATLSIFSDLETGLEEQGLDFQGHTEIFIGEKFTCEKAFEGNVFDCCRKLEGVAIQAKLARCTAKEKCLAQKREEGKCHFIGSHKINLRTVTEHVYCCFPTKLARVVHEQGRKQLGIKWGSADHPKCHGLTLDELQRINFGQIDLTEVVEDIEQNKKKDYAQKIHSSISSLQQKVQGDVRKKQQANQGASNAIP